MTISKSIIPGKEGCNMKKWKRTVVYGLLTVMAVGCVGAKAYPVMTEEKEGTAGRYMEKEILLPETGWWYL